MRKYEYEASGDSYNLVFEQMHHSFGTQEFVVYNPSGGQVMTGHALDLLEFSPAQLERSRGFYAMHDTPHRHWKRFLFD